jgi:hypothetical protein
VSQQVVTNTTTTYFQTAITLTFCERVTIFYGKIADLVVVAKEKETLAVKRLDALSLDCSCL